MMVRCALCDSAHDAAQVFTRHTQAAAVTYSRYDCSGCGGGWWEPPIAPGDQFYETQSGALSKSAAQRQSIGTQRLTAAQQLFLERLPKGISLTDIGCGDGLLMAMAATKSCKVTGCDFDSKAIAVAHKRGLEAAVASIPDFLDRVEPNSCDVISVFEVLEHQPDPAAFCSPIKRLLKHDGFLAGSVPNKHRMTRLQPQTWDQPPYHFSHWTIDSLDVFLRRVGLRPKFIVDVGHDYYLRGLVGRALNGVRQNLLADVSEAQRIGSLESMESRGAVSLHRARLFRAMRFCKEAPLFPASKAEALILRRMKRGQQLYFEATL